MFKKITAAFVATALGSVAVAQDKIAMLEERIAELEANQSINIFNFSGTFATRYDNVSVKQVLPVSATLADNKDLGYLRMRASLNADANISSNVKFYSRLTSSKHFNKWTTQFSGSAASTAGTDLKAADAYSDSNMVLEKAYLDMTIPNSNVTVSLGRLPTPDGSPSNFWDGRARMGTYPLMSYSSVLDGGAVTYKVDEYMPEGHKLAVRAIYAPFSTYTTGTNAYQAPPTNGVTTTGGTSGNKINTFSDFVTGQLDYSTDKFGFVNNFGFIVQYNQLNSLPAVLLTDSTLRFGLKATSAAIEMTGILGSPVDLSVSYLGTQIDSVGGAGAAAGNVGFGTALTKDTIRGSTSLVSARYSTPSWIFGAEYAKGTKGVFYSGNTVEDLTNMYGTPGTLTHGYVTHKFSSNLSLRAGYYQQKEDYTRVTVGAISKADKTVSVGYANFRADF